MIHLSDKQIAEFWHRSYAAADGLWFVKVEGRHGFDDALDIDNEVWKVLAKIQARMLKSICKVEKGLDGLYECLTTRLQLEGFDFEARKTGGAGFEVSIRRCPWHELMVKSGREKLSGIVGTLICNTEYSAWASEFGEDIRFELGEQVCKGAGVCVLRFEPTGH